jgi:hypothetical protein
MVERRTVDAVVAGSNPVIRPKINYPIRKRLDSFFVTQLVTRLITPVRSPMLIHRDGGKVLEMRFPALVTFLNLRTTKEVKQSKFDILRLS